MSWITGVILITLACAPPKPVAVNPSPPARDILNEAHVYYETGRRAMERGDWERARIELLFAADLLGRPLVVPDSLTAPYSALHGHIDAALAELASAQSPVPAGAAPVDSLYPEEKTEKAGFAYLLPLIPEESPAPAYNPPLPDVQRFDLPVVFNERVKAALYALQTDAKTLFAAWLNRINLYRPMVQSIFHREGLPKDLIYVALVESGFQPRACAPDGAAGLWQFMLPTGDACGLDRTPYIDERFDPEKSTWAVVQRFKALYNRLGSWERVIAAHHADLGPEEASVTLGHDVDVWRMSLPRDSRRFIACVMAAAIIAKDPAAYGFEIKSSPPLAYETVPNEAHRPLEEIADGAGLSVEHLKTLNPELRAWQAPAGYTLKIPVGAQPQYRSWAGLPALAPTPSDIMAYKVRRGDSLASIARRFGLDPGEIIAENDLSGTAKLKVGRVLFIPIYDKTASPPPQTFKTPEEPAPSPVEEGSPEEKGPDRITYRVKRGDTLAAIARRHRVSTADLQAWNNLKNPGAILAGQKLVIWVKRPAPKQARQATPSADRDAGAQTVVYTVKRGDTLWDIARRFNVTISAVRAANKLKRRAAIHPGDRLKIILPAAP